MAAVTTRGPNGADVWGRGGAKPRAAPPGGGRPQPRRDDMRGRDGFHPRPQGLSPMPPPPGFVLPPFVSRFGPPYDRFLGPGPGPGPCVGFPGQGPPLFMGDDFGHGHANPPPAACPGQGLAMKFGRVAPSYMAHPFDYGPQYHQNQNGRALRGNFRQGNRAFEPNRSKAAHERKKKYDQGNVVDSGTVTDNLNCSSSSNSSKASYRSRSTIHSVDQNAEQESKKPNELKKHASYVRNKKHGGNARNKEPHMNKNKQNEVQSEDCEPKDNPNTILTKEGSSNPCEVNSTETGDGHVSSNEGQGADNQSTAKTEQWDGTKQDRRDKDKSRQYLHQKYDRRFAYPPNQQYFHQNARQNMFNMQQNYPDSQYTQRKYPYTHNKQNFSRQYKSTKRSQQKNKQTKQQKQKQEPEPSEAGTREPMNADYSQHCVEEHAGGIQDTREIQENDSANWYNSGNHVQIQTDPRCNNAPSLAGLQFHESSGNWEEPHVQNEVEQVLHASQETQREQKSVKWRMKVKMRVGSNAEGETNVGHCVEGKVDVGQRGQVGTGLSEEKKGNLKLWVGGKVDIGQRVEEKVNVECLEEKVDVGLSVEKKMNIGQIVEEQGSVKHKVEGKVDVGQRVEGKVDVKKRVEEKVNVRQRVEGKVDVGQRVEGKVVVGEPVEGKADAGQSAEGKVDVGPPGKGNADLGPPGEGKSDVGQCAEGKRDVGRCVEGKRVAGRGVEMKGDVGWCVEGRGDVGRCVEGKGDVGPCVEGKGDLEPCVKGKGDIGPCVKGKGDAGPCVEGKGDVGPRVKGKRDVGQCVGGKGDVGQCVGGKGDVGQCVWEKGDVGQGVGWKGDVGQGVGGKGDVGHGVGGKGDVWKGVGGKGDVGQGVEGKGDVGKCVEEKRDVGCCMHGKIAACRDDENIVQSHTNRRKLEACESDENIYKGRPRKEQNGHENEIEEKSEDTQAVEVKPFVEEQQTVDQSETICVVSLNEKYQYDNANFRRNKWVFHKRSQEQQKRNEEPLHPHDHGNKQKDNNFRSENGSFESHNSEWHNNNNHRNQRNEKGNILEHSVVTQRRIYGKQKTICSVAGQLISKEIVFEYQRTCHTSLYSPDIENDFDDYSSKDELLRKLRALPNYFFAKVDRSEYVRIPRDLLHGDDWDFLSHGVWEKYLSNKQSNGTTVQKIMLWKELNTFLENNFPRYFFYMTGSSMNGFGLQCSDIDMCLLISDGQFIRRNEAISHLEHLFHSLLRSKLAKEAVIIRAKVPILKFQDCHWEYEIDVNCNNDVSVRNTHLLFCYSRLDWRVRPLMVTIKTWANWHKINNAKNMTISSYSLVLMVIHFLQCGVNPPVLPCLSKMYPDIFSPERNVFEIDVHERLPHYRSVNRQPLGQLLVEFMRYYIHFDYAHHAISVRLGTTLPIEECRRAPVPKNDERQWNLLCVEEPFERTNTAYAVYDQAAFERVMWVFHTTYKKLMSSRRISSIFHLKI